jgi:hypothetical protein
VEGRGGQEKLRFSVETCGCTNVDEGAIGHDGHYLAGYSRADRVVAEGFLVCFAVLARALLDAGLLECCCLILGQLRAGERGGRGKERGGRMGGREGGEREGERERESERARAGQRERERVRGRGGGDLRPSCPVVINFLKFTHNHSFSCHWTFSKRCN